MICSKCKEKMNWCIDGNSQGWICPKCGWNVITTYIDKIYDDERDYNLYIKKSHEINIEKIKIISQITNENYIVAKNILEKKEVCIMKGKAPEVKKTVEKLQRVNIDFEIIPPLKID